MEVRLSIWLELCDLVDLVELDVLADIELVDWLVDVAMLDALLLSLASYTWGHSMDGSIVEK